MSAVNTAELFVVPILSIAVGACTPTSPSSGITRERAVEIARQHLTFEPTSTAAAMGSRQGRSVWVVTFRKADGSHGGLGLFMEVSLDRGTGDVVSLAIS